MPARPGGRGIGAEYVKVPSSETAVLPGSEPTAAVVARTGSSSGGGSPGQPAATFVRASASAASAANTVRAVGRSREGVMEPPYRLVPVTAASVPLSRAG
jgi:hypothetical protein